MQLRFNLTTDCAVRNAGAYIDDIAVTNVMVPGPCATGSSCPNNPFVNVTPDGPLTLCSGDAQPLAAGLTGGSAPFTYQWMRDGSPVDGATADSYTATGAGTHVYNCSVQGAGCSDYVFDPTAVSITWQSQPVFAGITSVTNAMNGTCTLVLAWPVAMSLCPGGGT